MLGVCGVKAELFMQFADRSLFWRFVPLNLAAWEGDLPAMPPVLGATNQQHLAVERVRINALTTTGRAAAPERHRRNQQCSHHRNAGVAARGRIEVDRLKAW